MGHKDEPVGEECFENQVLQCFSPSVEAVRSKIDQEDSMLQLHSLDQDP